MKNLKLMITLGHNASAIGEVDNKLIGYEQERLNRIKACSNFPKLAINKVIQKFQIKEGDYINLYISHWFDNFEFYKMKNYKHYDYDFVEELKSKYTVVIYTLSENFNHHKAHAYSSLAFLKYSNPVEDLNLYYYLVIDGFGNRQRVLSLYNQNMNQIYSINDYCDSLGLLYQFATGYCGMKQNQDEYKFLGYQSHIQEISQDPRGLVQNIKYYAERFIKNYMSYIESPNMSSEMFNVEEQVNVDNLDFARTMIDNILDNYYRQIIDKYKIEDIQFNKRVIIGSFIQTVLEKYVINLIKRFNIKRLCVSGGVFYNVKLNNRILQQVDRLCVMPLAGDQGAAIGLYYYYCPKENIIDFRNLTIGQRCIDSDNIMNIQNIAKKLISGDIVNVVTGDMQFGPRALCNTSTLALPTRENVEFINTLNKRNTVMPMAPVVLQKNLDYFFYEKQYEKVVGSLEYMIITLRYREDVDIEKYGGVMHNWPISYDGQYTYSGRPQVVTDKLKDHYIYKLLTYMDENYGVKALINTSFNVHGRPICYSYKDGIDDFIFQIERSSEIETDKKACLIGGVI